MDGILLIVEGGENLGGLVEILSRSVPGEEEVPGEEHEVHEGSELDRLAVAGEICIFEGPEAEVEASGDQVSNVVGSGFGGGSCLSDDGVCDSQENGISRQTGGYSSP